MLKKSQNIYIEKHGSVSGYIFSKHKGAWRIALLKHKKLGRWVVPGGHIDPWENAEEAVIREAKEETGLDISLLSFIHKDNVIENITDKQILPPEFIFEQIIPARENEPEHIHIDHAYIGLAVNQNLQPQDGESNDIGWFTEKELDNLDIFSSVIVIAKKLFPLIQKI